MGTGRKPKPTYLKILEGNPGKRPLNDNEPIPPKEMPDCPSYIREDRIASKEWDRIVPILYDLNLLTRIDRSIIELYCVNYALFVWANEDIKKHGHIINTRYGQKANPAVTMAREAAKIIKACAVEFGCTPSSRSRLKVPKNKEEDDPMEELLSSVGNNKN
ncbi:MAG: phage terminase small subunit P27 family [Candidatus Pacearchaeota archaeon]|jgi:P27 family predicted phage terminase small subunit